MSPTSPKKNTARKSAIKGGGATAAGKGAANETATASVTKSTNADVPTSPTFRTIEKGIYERGIGSKRPWFQVRVRQRGEKDRQERFPYLPTLAQGNSRLMKRDAALLAAKAYAANERSEFHFFGKPKSQVHTSQTLREWIIGWKVEACDRLDPITRKPLDSMPLRKGAKQDAKQIMGLITKADDYAREHKRGSIMDINVVDLVLGDFQGSHGLLKMLTGRRLTRDAPTPDETESKKTAKTSKGEVAPKDTSKPPASQATQRRALALLGAVWSHARAYWGAPVMERPWKGCKVLGAQEKASKTTRALTIMEYEAVEAALALTDKKTLAAIHFLRWTAARSGEMQKLRWENITWPTPTNGLSLPLAKFEGTKTPKQGDYREREIHLVPGAQAALALLYEGTPPKEGIVFRSPTNADQPLSRHTAYQAFVRAIRRAKVPHARLHDLRHTRTTELSMSLHKAQAMLITGHSDERTFMRYTHLAEDAGTMIVAADARRAKASKAVVASVTGTSTTRLEDLVKDMTAEEKMKLIATLVGA